MNVFLAPYSPMWPELFLAEKQRLEEHISLPTMIEHIGSTSVEGLCAKPIIDMMIGTADESELDIAVPQIQTAGYEYISTYEDVMPFRRFFVKEENGVRKYQIHMVSRKSTFWSRHVLFRDYLRAHPETAREYAALKQQLAARDWDNVNDYADAKTTFIRRVEASAAIE